MGAHPLLVMAVMLQPVSEPLPRWQSGRTLGAVVAAGTISLAVLDEPIARWFRQASVQGDSGRHGLVSSVTTVNEIPLTLGALTVYGVGRVTRQPTVSDVGLHLSESLLATGVIAEVLRIALGRARPRASPDDAFVFRPGRGATQFEYRAFPSMHATVAFATAGALAEEMKLRRARSRRWLTPVLYAAAAIPGFTRLYLDQHWASDIFAGSVFGEVLGRRIVRYGHRHQSATEVAVLGCRNAVRSSHEMRSASDSVRFTDATPQPGSGRLLTLRGRGSYRMRGTQEWREFSYDCTYDKRKGTARVVPRLQADTRP
jgi:membrane-associated phospholipid phosphatase